jgi:hypothetical protein
VSVADQRDFAGAAALLQPFTVYLLVLRIIAPASESHWAHADPILLLLPRALTLALVPALGVTAAVLWLSRVRPRLRLGEAALGVAAGCLLVLVLRAFAGARLPAFIPPEESAGPGFLLNMTAGYAEEVLFRLALLPLAWLGLRRLRLPRAAAALTAAALTGLAFALFHDAAWSSLFVTRFLLPGFAFSLVALFRPTFLVCAHCAAHVLIPALFA